MPIVESTRRQAPSKPYSQLREDPKFDQIKRLIENLPPEKIGSLEKYIQRLSSDSLSAKTELFGSR